MDIEAGDEIGHCRATAKASLASCLCKRLALRNRQQGVRPSDLIHSFTLRFGGPFQPDALISIKGRNTAFC